MDEPEFIARFPRLFVVRALTRFEAARLELRTDVTMWQYLSPFEFVSQAWGSIVIPTGMFTDFASVPKFLHGLYDDDSPTLLFPSAAHDLLFKAKDDGSRGWLPDGQQLSLTEANHVLVEGMQACGADDLDCVNVYAAVQLANQRIKHTFRSAPP